MVHLPGMFANLSWMRPLFKQCLMGAVDLRLYNPVEFWKQKRSIHGSYHRFLPSVSWKILKNCRPHPFQRLSPQQMTLLRCRHWHLWATVTCTRNSRGIFIQCAAVTWRTHVCLKNPQTSSGISNMIKLYQTMCHKFHEIIGSWSSQHWVNGGWPSNHPAKPVKTSHGDYLDLSVHLTGTAAFANKHLGSWASFCYSPGSKFKR